MIMKERVILCVDDEDTVLRSLKRELRETLGDRYIIETVSAGQEALELFDELLSEGYEIPLVIADQIMPHMKGDELLHKIHEVSPKTLKIMLTGQADMQAVVNALNQANLYRYIAKPWEKIDLAMTVKEAMQSYLQDKELELKNTILQETNRTLEMKVKERTAQLEAQKLELKQLNASKDKFFSIIAHDLRAPFSGLLGLTDFIIKNVEQFTQRDVKENLTELRDVANTVYGLLENLLAWSRLQRGAMEHAPENVALHALADQIVRLFATHARQKEITLVNRVPHDLAAYVDSRMLDTVLRNLVSNALKFSDKGGKIQVMARRNGTGVELAVADTGTGIPASDLPHLFRIDVKYSNAGTAGEEGTGLGLILCKDLVERNSGRIWVESRVGQGSTFTMRLPGPRA
jgi:two-component system, sensor histidine kinase and response regulator